MAVWRASLVLVVCWTGSVAHAMQISPLAAKIDRLTMVDKALFSAALRGFFREIRELEASLGRRVMCPSSLQEAEPRLAYIANVTALYEISSPGSYF